MQEHVLTTILILDRSGAAGLPLWNIHLDFSKAFDTVKWETYGNVIFFSSHLFPQPSLVQTVVLGSLQEHEEHEGHGKSQGPMRVLTKVGEVDWKEVGLPGLPPGFGSSWDD